MRNTCLYPFYEYIFRNWIQSKETMPDFETQFYDEMLELSGLKIQKLTNRKKYIWENTRLILDEATSSLSKQNMLHKLLKQPIKCDLCFYCQKCEKKYWQALKELLFDNDKSKNQISKPDFMIPTDIRELLKQKERPVDIYLNHYKRRVWRERNILVMLKGFSSSTPILLNYAQNTNFYSGGGFYIRWNGIGIAVDPGYLFVQNLQSYGLGVLDIDVVIITHEHIDHNSDMRILDDLHYNVSKSLMERALEWDKEKYSASYGPQKRHKIKWYMDVVTCEEAVVLAQKKSGFDKNYNKLFCVNIANENTTMLEEKFQGFASVITEKNIDIDEDINLHIFQTAHEQYDADKVKKFFPHTYGCVIECGQDKVIKRSIGYTSDTSVQENTYSDMVTLLSQCHIIIANISGIYEEDVLFKKFKDRHLGYYGCYKIGYDIINKKDYVLKYILLSEFSNQVSDIRFGVSRYLQYEIDNLVDQKDGTPVQVMPTEIELTLDIDTFQTRCSICGTYCDKVHILRPHGENRKLLYICSGCMYSSRK